MLATSLAAVLLTSQDPAPGSPPTSRPLPPITHADSLNWEALSGTAISDDGRWHAARVGRVGGASEIRVRSVDGPEKWTISEGQTFAFSDDSKWFATVIGPSRAQAEALQEQRRTPDLKLTLRSLPSGEETSFDRVARWGFLKGSKTLVMLHQPPAASPGAPPAPPTGGSDFVSYSLETKEALPITNVATFQVNDKGLIALVIASPSGSKGLQLFNPLTNSLKTLAWGKADIRGVSWAKEAPVLAWMESIKDPKKQGDSHQVKIASGVGGETLSTRTLDTKTIADWPEGWRIAEGQPVTLSPDGRKAAFSIQAWNDRQENPPKPSTVSSVEIWSTKDTEVVPLQRNEGPQSRLVVWSPEEGKGRVLSSVDEQVIPTRSLDRIFTIDGKAHATPVKVNGLEYSDVYAVDSATGARTLLAKKLPSNVGGAGTSTLDISETGRYATWFEGTEWRLYDSQDGSITPLKGPAGASFTDPEDDATLPFPTTGSSPIFTKGDKSLLLSSYHDVYRVNPASKIVTRLTQLKDENVRAFPLDLDTDDDSLDESQGLYFSLLDRDNMSTGVARLEPDGTTKVLILEDKALGLFRRSKGTDRVTFRRQSASDSPAEFVTNLAFSAAKPVVRTNPQQKDFAWGKAELISYKNRKGQDLKGVLHYPANYQPGQFYPMVTYIYERLSQTFHQYQQPNPDFPYNAQNFIQKGYFVLMPDITYERRNPGLSAQDCIEAAVRTAIRKRVGVDPTRVGLMGHSWGGYQSAFMATHSKVFRAYVAGAPLTELVAMYSGFYFNWGQSNQVIFESSQGRMEVPFWEDLKSYMDNSPLYHATKITSPMLIEAGTADGAVDWTQSQFLYNTMRRMGKDLTLLVYPGENHNNALLANRRDYARRIEHFFDVHLKGAKPDPWLEKGIPFRELEPERVRLTSVPAAPPAGGAGKPQP